MEKSKNFRGTDFIPTTKKEPPDQVMLDRESKLGGGGGAAWSNTHLKKVLSSFCVIVTQTQPILMRNADLVRRLKELRT